MSEHKIFLYLVHYLLSSSDDFEVDYDLFLSYDSYLIVTFPVEMRNVFNSLIRFVTDDISTFGFELKKEILSSPKGKFGIVQYRFVLTRNR